MGCPYQPEPVELNQLAEVLPMHHDRLRQRSVNRQAGDARAGRDNVDPVAVIGQLTDALAQWRGPAGEGVPRSTSLDNRWATLDERRLQIFEELAEVRLTVGEQARPAGRLPALVREYAAELAALPSVPRQLINGWRSPLETTQH
ncbi:BTAD domain-containing putative transcriptional regulator [Micromonospora sp. U21]|uniref:BTAD domain-containing putative transcriptional regulator n=1 Tax=Micromonospora sp. U21 TaxID=2824899 RepID=UPI0027DABD10|nr:BTAD domain-containing putative transcriptional regulator [Micromonospora sp. U21]